MPEIAPLLHEAALGVSSLLMVPVATEVPKFALVADESVTVIVSLLSLVVSPQTATVIVAEVEPTGIETVPLAVMKSVPVEQLAPPVAVPLLVV